MMEIQDLEGNIKKAKMAYQAGDFHQAADLYSVIAAACQAQENPLLAAEMTNNQSVALLQAGDSQAALDAAAGTDLIFEGAGDQLKMAMAIGNQAAALDALSQVKEAEQKYLRCAEILALLGEDQLRSQVMQSLSALQLRSGRQLEALSSMQTGLNKLEKPTIRQRLLKRLLSLPGKLFPR
jgi:hypothetical protein